MSGAWQAEVINGLHYCHFSIFSPMWCPTSALLPLPRFQWPIKTIQFTVIFRDVFSNIFSIIFLHIIFTLFAHYKSRIKWQSIHGNATKWHFCIYKYFINMVYCYLQIQNIYSKTVSLCVFFFLFSYTSVTGDEYRIISKMWHTLIPDILCLPRPARQFPLVILKYWTFILSTWNDLVRIILQVMMQNYLSI